MRTAGEHSVKASVHSATKVQKLASARTLLGAIVLGVMLGVFLTPTRAAGPDQPNFVFILADDLGWRDLGCYGSPFCETPNIDRLAAQGMKFTQAYSAGSVCSPTRSSIQTGKYPPRNGITDWIPGQNVTGRKLVQLHPSGQLPAAELTIAEALKAGGYQTFYGGKWHLGEQEGAPRNQGYDVVLPERENDEGNGARKPGIERGRTIAKAAIEFIQKRDRSKPFFAFLGFHEPHTPIEDYPDYIAHFRAKAATLGDSPAPLPEHDGKTRAAQDNAAYGSEVAGLDNWVGMVLQAVEQQDLAKSTIVIFLSDNGGLATTKTGGPTSNAPLRSGKGWLYEGGIRVPLIIRAPDATRPGSSTDVPVITTDFFPTILELAGLPPRPQQHLDGVSFVGLLRGAPAPAARPLFWHYPHYHGSTWTPGAAVRDGDWKLIEFFDYGNIELYNLKQDPGESNDLAKTNPDRARQLVDQLHAWQKSVGALKPEANPAPTNDPPPGKKRKRKSGD